MRTAKETKAVMDSPGLDKNQILQMQKNIGGKSRVLFKNLAVLNSDTNIMWGVAQKKICKKDIGKWWNGTGAPLKNFIRAKIFLMNKAILKR